MRNQTIIHSEDGSHCLKTSGKRMNVLCAWRQSKSYEKVFTLDGEFVSMIGGFSFVPYYVAVTKNGNVFVTRIIGTTVFMSFTRAVKQVTFICSKSFI